MELMLKFPPTKNETSIHYQNKIMLIGSCFTEHIGNFLLENKFSVLQNPNGILFDTLSVCRALNSYLEDSDLSKVDLFYLDERWHSWQHHSMFSGIQKDVVIDHIRSQKKQASKFLKQTDWLILTLGSSFAYQLNPATAKEFAIEDFVANCHKAPQQWFNKYLIPIEEQIHAMAEVIEAIRKINPGVQIIFTISPVRHIRDGVVENNRSKARLIEVVHHLKEQKDKIYYFPAYELLIDVLRDYRFYDIDLVHPNYTATNFVLNRFCNSFLDDFSIALLEKIKPIMMAKKHKPFHPDSAAHQRFLQQNLQKINEIIKEYPYLNFEKEIEFFTNVVV